MRESRSIISKNIESAYMKTCKRPHLNFMRQCLYHVSIWCSLSKWRTPNISWIKLVGLLLSLEPWASLKWPYLFLLFSGLMITWDYNFGIKQINGWKMIMVDKKTSCSMWFGIFIATTLTVMWTKKPVPFHPPTDLTTYLPVLLSLPGWNLYSTLELLTHSALCSRWCSKCLLIWVYSWQFGLSFSLCSLVLL